jgi:hypothetical protein
MSRYELAKKETLLKKIDELESEVSNLNAAVTSVADLIANSDGVSGLHANGDIAGWDELLEGGHFEEWLIDFSKALES